MLKQVSLPSSQGELVRLAIVLLSACLVAATTASAQEATTFGVKSGVNFSSATTDDPLVDTSYRAGFTGGLFAWLPVNDRVSFQPEFLYAYKRTAFAVAGEEATVSVHYAEVPFLMDVRLNNAPSRVSLLVGPSLSLRGRARLKVNGVSSDATDLLDRVDFGIVTGLAVTIDRLVIDGRFTWGLVNVSSEEGEGTAKTRSFAVTAGWRFR